MRKIAALATPLVTGLILPLTTLAQGTDLVPNKSPFEYTWCDFFALAQNVINLLAAVAGPIILVFVIIAGVRYVSGALSGDEEAIDNGKDGLSKAIFGFVMVLCAYVIINTAIIAVVGTVVGRTPITSFFDISCNITNTVPIPQN